MPYIPIAVFQESSKAGAQGATAATPTAYTEGVAAGARSSCGSMTTTKNGIAIAIACLVAQAYFYAEAYIDGVLKESIQCAGTYDTNKTAVALGYARTPVGKVLEGKAYNSDTSARSLINKFFVGAVVG